MSNLMVNDRHNVLQIRNATVTTLSHHAKDLWKSPSGTVIRIEILVVVSASVFLFLTICGSKRRRHTDWFIQKGVFSAYVLSFSLVTYTLGSMQSSTVKNSMYPIWAISLFILDGCTDSITAYSLDDNTKDIRLIYQAFMYVAYGVFLVITILSVLGKSVPLRSAVLYLCDIAFNKFMHKQAAYVLASRSWNMKKMVADYMYDEHKKGKFDPVTMEGCHYLVDWPLDKSKFCAPSYATQLTTNADEIIDIDKIWRSSGRSLGPEPKDTCLSFSLFHLLRRRFFGFVCGESKERAHDFVFRGLLSDNEDGTTDYNRVFKVIEVKLAFMYDFLFTKYATIYYGSGVATVWAWVSVFFISFTIYMTARHMITISSVQDESVISTTTADAAITFLLLGCTSFLELLQLLLYRTSIWARVSYVCQHLRDRAILNRRGSCCMRFLTKICMYRASNEHYWKHKLEQFSLLESVSYNPKRNPSNKLAVINLWRSVSRITNLIDPMTINHLSYLAWKVHQRLGKSIELTTEVKQALINTLKRTNGTLTNGKSSLEVNEANCLLWACARDMHSDSSRSQTNENQTPYFDLAHCNMLL